MSNVQYILQFPMFLYIIFYIISCAISVTFWYFMHILYLAKSLKNRTFGSPLTAFYFFAESINSTLLVLSFLISSSLCFISSVQLIMCCLSLTISFPLLNTSLSNLWLARINNRAISIFVNFFFIMCYILEQPFGFFAEPISDLQVFYYFAQ